MTALRKMAATVGATAGAVSRIFSLRSKESKARQWRRFLGEAETTKRVIASFEEYIRTEAQENLKSFRDRLRASPEAALAEATVFGVLQQLQLRPRIADVAGSGGADFICMFRPIRFTDRGSSPLMVEATSLEPSAVERGSGWRDELPDEVTGGAFSLLTSRIINRAASKVPQLSRHQMPRVLVIVSSHIGGSALLSSRLAAQSVLTSNPKIAQPIGGGEATQIVDLKSSVFLKGHPETGEVTAQRQTISAILLMSVAGNQSSILGILHPEARYPLDINAFPEVPFVKIERWPIENGVIRTEWVVGQPSHRTFKHRLIKKPRR